MRWRMIDRVTHFDPWQSATGIKAVSLEEYDLLLPLGREADFPESLVLESTVELARWMVLASSQFTLTARLSAVEHFEIVRGVGAGEVMRARAMSADRADDSLGMDIGVETRGLSCARGRITMDLIPLDECADAAMLSGIWSEIYAPS